MPTPDFNLLLAYLSALGAGSWQTFKVAVREVGTALWPDDTPLWLATVTAEQLVALGHVELAFEGDLSWSVCPPVLAGIPAWGQGRAVLCGARTETTLETVRRAAQRLGMRSTTKDQRLAPSVVQIEGAAEHDLVALAAEAGLEYVPDAAGRLLGCLPTLGSMLAVAPSATVPSGYGIRRFDPAALQWRDVDHVREDGSYRFDCYRPEYQVIRRGSAKRVSQSLAVYHALACAGVTPLRRNAQEGRLSLPATTRLPALYARALVLHSGEVPSYDPRTGLLHFALPSSAFVASLGRKLLSLEEPHG